MTIKNFIAIGGNLILHTPTKSSTYSTLRCDCFAHKKQHDTRIEGLYTADCVDFMVFMPLVR
jgi:hypothetical protein